MQANQIPTKFQIPFGNSATAGTIRPVPVADQTATSPGAASLTTGFPVATGQPLASGGIPPSMQDFNGLFNQITAWNRWQNAGGTVPFDQAFATAIGGYPYGAIVQSTTGGKLWLNTVDNNASNPDGGSASGWVAIGAVTASFPTGSFVPLPGITVPSDTTAIDWVVPNGYDYFRFTGMLPGGGGNINILVSADGTTFLQGNGDYKAGYTLSNNAATPYSNNPFYSTNSLGFSALCDDPLATASVIAVFFRGSGTRSALSFGNQQGYNSSIPGFTQASFTSRTNLAVIAQKLRFIPAFGVIKAGGFIGIEGFKTA